MSSFAASELLARQIDALLPQWQCGMCSFGGCLPYAQALAAGDTTSNRCSPGGLAVLQGLNRLTGQSHQNLLAECLPVPSGAVALIDEQWCIGCTKCIAVCPVDAIIGANKKMHTVMAQACTGCDLCQAVCPVDCISMVERGQPMNTQLSRDRAQQNRDRLTTPSVEAPALTVDSAAILAAAFAKAQKS